MTKVVDSVTKKHLILLTYKAMNGVSYDEMHKAVKEFQDLLERKYRVTFGYKFEDISIYEIWDNELQMDLEAYECVDLDVTHDNDNLMLGEEGESTIKIFAEPDLQRKFNDKRIAKKLLKNLKEIKKNIAS